RLLFSPDSAATPAPTSGASGLPSFEPLSPGTSAAFPPPPPLDDTLLLAKTYFDTREYRRCAHWLDSQTAPAGQHALPQQAIDHRTFLRLYALHLAGESRKQEEQHERPAAPHAAAQPPHAAAAQQQSNKKPPSSATNRELPYILSQLQGTSDPFCLYLLALVAQQLAQPALALSSVLSSLRAFPCNWSAWLLLGGLVGGAPELMSLALPEHFMRSFFYAHYFVELHPEQSDDERLSTLLTQLQTFFPASSHLLTVEAVLHYVRQHYDEAQAILAHLYAVYPHRLEQLDTYSNILYVKEDAATLSFLAHHLARQHKYSAVTQCVVGNYYALKSQHARSILHFQRALALNPHCLSAYTLMGHEYIELQQPAAAILSYRRAIDISGGDFRAWYGLGQAYELLGEDALAVYYYREGCRLRPFDARMWCAQGTALERMGRDEEAVRCFERAMGEDDREGIALGRLARLYQKRNDVQEAVRYWRLVLHKQDELERGDSGGGGAMEGEEGGRDGHAMGDDGDAQAVEGGAVSDRLSQSAEALEAITFLVERAKLGEQWRQCEYYIGRLLDAGGSYAEQARSLSIEIRNMRGAARDEQQGGPALFGGGGSARSRVLSPLSERATAGGGARGQGGGFFSPGTPYS
ncbi:anaphase-promoting complex component apc8, partial [Xylographa carneopallida]|nr:anaphase-promoting complex component apc8 [Xylographa carneopallida]